MMKIRKKYLISFILVFPVAIFASDANQLLSDQEDTKSFEKSLEKYSSEKSPYLSDDEVPESIKKSTQTPAVQPYLYTGEEDAGSEERVMQTKERFKDSGYTTPGTYEDVTQYVEYRNDDLLESYKDKGKSNISFIYLRDRYSYKDGNDAYDRTYRDSFGSKNPGFLFVSYDRYLSKGFVNTYWGVNLGIGYSSGKGYFIDGSQSNAGFTLWQLPFDLNVGFEMPLGEYIKFALDAGPSVMGLIQVRDDREEGDRGKRTRQFGLGRYVGGRLQFNFSRLNSNFSYSLFSDQSISNLSFNIELRNHSYSKFKDDDVEISGTSFGLGFSFEFI